MGEARWVDGVALVVWYRSHVTYDDQQFKLVAAQGPISWVNRVKYFNMLLCWAGHETVPIVLGKSVESVAEIY